MRITGAAVALLLFGFRTVASGDESGADIAARFRQLEREIPALYLLNGLCLSREQYAKLSAVHDRVRVVEERFGGKLSRSIERVQRDLERQAEDIVKNASRGRGPSDAALESGPRAERIRNARREIGALRWEQQKALDELADEAWALLTDSQRQVAGGFVPCFIPARDFRDPERVGQASADNSLVENVLTRLRRQSAAERESLGFDAAVDALAAHAMEQRHIKYTKEAELEVRDEIESGLRGVMKALAAGSDADFELDRGALAKRVFTPPGADGVSDPNAARRTMRNYVLNPAIADVVAARGGAGASSRAGVDACERAGFRSLELAGELRAAALLAGLSLSREQTAELLATVRGALAEQEKIERQKSAAMKDALPAYEALRGMLAAGTPDSGSEGRAAGFHGRVRKMQLEDMVSALLPYERRVDSLLSASQVDMLTPVEDKAPPRTVMASRAKDVEASEARAGNLIAKARRMSAIEFEREGRALARSSVEADSAEAGRGAFDVESEAARILEVLGRARGLGAADFRAQSDSLVSEACPRRAAPREIEFGSHYHRGRPMPEISGAGRLLFTETACEILDKMARRAGTT